jgi:hypothetical protein
MVTIGIAVNQKYRPAGAWFASDLLCYKDCAPMALFIMKTLKSKCQTNRSTAIFLKKK